MKQSSLFQMAHLCQRVFDAYGLDQYSPESADELERRMRAIGKNERQRPFDETRLIIPKHRSLTLMFQYRGQDVAGVQARMLDLGKDQLASLLQAEARVVHKFNLTQEDICPTAKDIRGRVAYMGEFFIAKEWRGRPALSAAISRYIQCLAFAKWRLDWVYVFIKKHEIESKNRAVQYGFCTLEPNALPWTGVEDRRRDSGEYLAANSRRQLAHMMRSCIQDADANFPGYADLFSGNGEHIEAGAVSAAE